MSGVWPFVLVVVGAYSVGLIALFRRRTNGRGRHGHSSDVWWTGSDSSDGGHHGCGGGHHGCGGGSGCGGGGCGGGGCGGGN